VWFVLPFRPNLACLLRTLLWQIAQATSNQMARHDSLRPCMDVIDEIMTEMVCMLRSYNNFYDTGFWVPARCCHRLGAFTE